MLKLASQIFGAYFVVALILVGYFSQRSADRPRSAEPEAPVINALGPADNVDDAADASSPVRSRTPAVPANLPKELLACKGLATEALPGVNAERLYTAYTPVVEVNGSVRIATAPIEKGCWASPFGPRNGSLHKGVDYHNPDRTDVYAGGDGIIRQRTYHDDYGNMLVIDHGDGVFTRYAHLESFAQLGEGDRVIMGQVIGVMGNSASHDIPRHLHYELLIGEWGERSGSFALEPADIMDQPAAG